jgi:hypothetical protein
MQTKMMKSLGLFMSLSPAISKILTILVGLKTAQPQSRIQCMRKQIEGVQMLFRSKLRMDSSNKRALESEL